MDGLIDMLAKARGEVVSDPKDADAFAWAATSPTEPKLTQIAFKHPPLPDNGVRIQVTYTGICQSDVSIIRKKYGDLLPSVWPCVCGHEITGRVKAVGKDVKTVKEGELVGVGPMRECCQTCDNCKSGSENLCSAHTYRFTAGCYFGGFATEIQIPDSFIIKLPDGINEKLSPSLFCAGGTIFNPLKRFAKQGSKVGIIGIGGLGHLGIKFANKMGCKVYAISTSDSKKALALSMGAHEFVVSKNEDEFKKFQGEALDLIINTASVPDIMPYVRALKKGTGVIALPAVPEGGLTLSAPELILNQWTVTGSAAFSLEDAKDMLDLVVKHDIYPECEFFTWDNFNEAFEKCEKNTVQFRSIIDISTFKP